MRTRCSGAAISIGSYDTTTRSIKYAISEFNGYFLSCFAAFVAIRHLSQQAKAAAFCTCGQPYMLTASQRPLACSSTGRRLPAMGGRGLPPTRDQREVSCCALYVPASLAIFETIITAPCFDLIYMAYASASYSDYFVIPEWPPGTPFRPVVQYAKAPMSLSKTLPISLCRTWSRQPERFTAFLSR